MKTTLFIAVILLFECAVFAQDTPTDVGERQRIYAVNRNDLAIQIAFVFQKDEDIRPYMQLLESLEFTDEIRLK